LDWPPLDWPPFAGLAPLLPRVLLPPLGPFFAAPPEEEDAFAPPDLAADAPDLAPPAFAPPDFPPPDFPPDAPPLCVRDFACDCDLPVPLLAMTGSFRWNGSLLGR
jgi:hypothetical protein